MPNFAAAYYDFLSADGTLTAFLAAKGANPGVFSDPPPRDALTPYIVTSAVVGSPALLCKQSNGWEHQRDIRCYVGRDTTRSVQLVNQIEERVIALVEDELTPITVAGETVVDFRVLTAVPVDDEEAFGRVVTTSLVIA